jgi:hypothetical protein
MESLRTIEFDEGSNAYIIRNGQLITCALLHTLRPLMVEGPTSLEVAADYLRGHSELLGLKASELDNLARPAEDDSTSAPVEYRFLSEKRQFDVITVTFQKTSMATPVWQEGLSVHLKELATISDPVQGGQDSLPAGEQTARHFQVVCVRTSGQAETPAVDVERLAAARPQRDSFATQDLARQIDLAKDGTAYEFESLHIFHQRSMIYRYDAGRRLRRDLAHLAIPLLPVPSHIADGRSYHVAATYFEFRPKNLVPSRWLAMVERESGSILYIEPLAGGIDGLVFLADPVTSRGGPMPIADNALLDPCRVSEPLPGLDPPGTVQRLAGANVKIVQFSGPVIAPPSRPPGVDFDFDVRTDEFAAVNAYYHCDRFFRFVESLGFVRDDYFPGTEFPIAVDHRGSTSHFPIGPGIEIAAQCNPKIKSTPEGDVIVGIESVVFGVAENTVSPYVGIANRSREPPHRFILRERRHT